MTRPMYWSLRRELWENRFLYIAPLIVTAVVLFAALISNSFSLPNRMMRAMAADPAAREGIVATPFSLPPAPIMLSTFIVGVFYCLDALYGERRDRSVLFWKSLPVSDRTVVVSKVGIPMLVMPAIALSLGIAVQIILLAHGTLVLLLRGVNPMILWGNLEVIPGWLVMIYGLTAHVLWYAPIYGWLLLVSAWAKRAPVLWAVTPLMAIAAFEKVAFNSMNFMDMLQYRVGGALQEAFIFKSKNHDLEELRIFNFYTRPGLWAGLLFAALCIALAVRLRRNREPI